MIGLILAGGRGTRVSSLSRLPKPLLPLAGKPVIAHIVDELRRHRVREIVIVVSSKDMADAIVEALHIKNHDPFYRFVIQHEPKGPGHAIMVGMGQVGPTDEPIVVCCADTIFRVNELSRTSTVYTAQAPLDEDPSRWCYVQSDPQWGDHIEFIDKPASRPKTRQINIGLYVFADTSTLHPVCSGEYANHMHNLDREWEISDILRLYGMENFTAEPVQEWLDTGTPDSFMKARRKRFVSRAFNHLELRQGVLVKRSNDKKTKLEDEYEWYRAAEARLGHHIPTDVHFDRDLGVLTMGYVPYNTASDYFLFDGSIDPENFVDSLLRIHDLVDAKDKDVPGMRKATLLIEKVEKRIAQASGPVAGRMHDLWAKLKPAAVSYISEMGNDDSYFHGDLNLTNILLDGDDFVVVDPRGEEFGDRRYDLAKILQSLWGYDHVINGLYEWRNGVVQPHYTTTQVRIIHIYISRLQDMGVWPAVCLYAATQFLSLIPLHAEDPERQRAFLSLSDLYIEEALRVVSKEEVPA